ncbi:mechanosensitive ion channel domain-containing protein [Candidatus Omnitrophota bacterium]
MKKKAIIGLTLVIIFFVTLSAYVVCAQDEKASGGTSSAVKAGEKTIDAGTTAKKEAVKQVEEQQKETKAKIEQETKDVVEAQKAIEEVQTEKEVLVKEAQLKEEEAKLAQKELEIFKEEAALTNGTKASQKIQELEEKLKVLQAEALAQKKKLELTNQKEDIAQKRLVKEQSEIDQVREQLQALMVQRSGMRSATEKLMHSAVIILVGLMLFLLLRLGVRALEKAVAKKETTIRESELELRLKTLGKLFNWLGGILIVIAIIYQLMLIYGFNPGPLIAGAGVIGIAFGFGGQYLIRDLINGLFILVEGQYRINDVVKIADRGGLVEDINLRITTLRDLAGRVIIIPNGEIKTVINFTRGYAQALMDIGVAYKENVDQVIQVIKEVGEEMRKDEYFGRLIIGDLEMFGVDDFADSAVMIKFRIKTKPIKQWEVSREFKRRLKNRFDELGIEIPFPHRTLYWGTDKENQWLKDSVEKMAQ